MKVMLSFEILLHTLVSYSQQAFGGKERAQP